MAMGWEVYVPGWGAFLDLTIPPLPVALLFSPRSRRGHLVVLVLVLVLLVVVVLVVVVMLVVVMLVVALVVDLLIVVVRVDDPVVVVHQLRLVIDWLVVVVLLVFVDLLVVVLFLGVVPLAASCAFSRLLVGVGRLTLSGYRTLRFLRFGGHWVVVKGGDSGGREE